MGRTLPGLLSVRRADQARRQEGEIVGLQLSRELVKDVVQNRLEERGSAVQSPVDRICEPLFCAA